jgi:hypothetical protein
LLALDKRCLIPYESYHDWRINKAFLLLMVRYLKNYDVKNDWKDINMTYGTLNDKDRITLRNMHATEK